MPKKSDVIIERKRATPVDMATVVVRLRSALEKRNGLLDALGVSIRRLEAALQQQGLGAFERRVAVDAETVHLAWRRLKPLNVHDVEVRWRFVLRVLTPSGTQEICLTDAPMHFRIAVAIALPRLLPEILEQQVDLLERCQGACAEIDRLSATISKEST